MDKLLPTAIIVLVLIVVFGSWALAWRSRRRRQAGLGEVPAPPPGLGTPHAVVPALYLATTRSDAPLERIAIGGLGFRARATVRVHDEGLEIELAGRPSPVFLARDRILSGGRANWTIDRGSGGDRLVFVRWRVGDADAEIEVDSYLRSDDPEALLGAVAPLFTSPTESETS